MTTTIHGVLAASNADNVLTATVKVRSNFSVTHLLTAAHFSRMTAQVERDNEGKPFGDFYDEVIAYATACVLTSVAALESYANEMFTDYPIYFPNTDGPLLQKLWGFYEAKPLLDKFQFALFLRHAPELDRGARPYQDIDALITLRHALTHFKPEWDSEQVQHGKVSSRLRGRFAPSPHYRCPLFPKGWATAGCTKWAVDSCIEFVTRFEDQAGLDHRLDKFMHRLSAE